MDTERTRLIPRSNLNDHVYRLLWDRILERRLNPGEKLSDLRLSRELDVSRTPVREALLRLVQDGLVRAEPNHGFYVLPISDHDIAEIYDLRATLETMALEVAAPRFNRGALEAALADLDRVEARILAAAAEAEHAAASVAFLEVDRAFHRMLVEQAGNSRLRVWVEGLWAQIAVFQQVGTDRPSWTEAAIRRHRSIIAALLAGDPEAAVAELRSHIWEVKDFVLADLRAIQEEQSAHRAPGGRSRRSAQSAATLQSQPAQAEGDAT